MGLAIDGNEVHGIAKGGQAFLPIDKNNEDGSINIDGRKYVTMPVSFTIPEGTHVSDGEHASGFTLSTDCNVTCVGTSNKFYYFCGEIEFTEGYDGGEWYMDNPQDVYGRDIFYPPLFIKKDKVKNIRWQ